MCETPSWYVHQLPVPLRFTINVELDNRGDGLGIRPAETGFAVLRPRTSLTQWMHQCLAPT